MWPFKTKKEKPATLESLALTKLRRLKRLKKRSHEKAIHGIAKLFRVYVEKKHKLKKGLIHEEFSEAIKQKRMKRSPKIKIIYFSALLNEIEYGEKEINSELCEEMITKMEEIIKHS